MNSKTFSTLCASGLLAATAVVLLVMPGHVGVRTNLASVTPPEAYQLHGIVRDFRDTHPDFDLGAGPGGGHYAGLINRVLPSNRIPVLGAGAGYRVLKQWTDAEGRNIAPHLANAMAPPFTGESLGLRVEDEIKIGKDAFIDGFNSNRGAYGEWGNYGADALVSTNATGANRIELDSKAMIRGPVYVGPSGDPGTVIDNDGTITGYTMALVEAYPMDPVDLPEGLDLEVLVPSLDVTGTVTLTGDMNEEDDNVPPVLYYGTLNVHSGGVLFVEGDLHVRIDGGLTLDKGQIVLGLDANLTFYVADGADIKIKESLVDTANASTDGVMINAAGAGRLEIEKKSYVSATLNAPARLLKVHDDSHLYGSYIGGSLDIGGGYSAVHVDLSNARAEHKNFTCMVREKIHIDSSIIDGFDSNDGPYGGVNRMSGLLMANVYEGTKKKGDVKIGNGCVVSADVLIGPGGPAADAVDIDGGASFSGTVGSLTAPNTIPMIAPPPMGPSVGDVTYKDETVTFGADLHCKKLKLERNVVFNVSGDRTIRCDDKMEVLDGSNINLLPGATLTIYFKKELKVKKNATLNMNTGNPQLVSIRATNGGKGKIEIDEGAAVAAWMQGAKSDLHVHDAIFHGSFAGKKAHIKNSTFCVDMAYMNFCVDVNDKVGNPGSTGDGQITSDATLSQWFHSVLGVNQAVPYSINLTKNGLGVYEYLDDDFHPIDGRLLDDGSDPHNHDFTYTIDARFTAADCGGQFFEFEGGDGAWLFIDHQLVMDLGGVGTSNEQFVEIDRLGLMPGSTYNVRLLYAQRRASTSTFRLRTNVELESAEVQGAVTGMFD